MVYTCDMHAYGIDTQTRTSSMSRTSSCDTSTSIASCMIHARCHTRTYTCVTSGDGVVADCMTYPLVRCGIRCVRMDATSIRSTYICDERSCARSAPCQYTRTCTRTYTYTHSHARTCVLPATHMCMCVLCHLVIAHVYVAFVCVGSWATVRWRQGVWSRAREEKGTTSRETLSRR